MAFKVGSRKRGGFVQSWGYCTLHKGINICMRLLNYSFDEVIIKYL